MRLRRPIETVTSHIITPHWYRPDKPGFPYEPAYEALNLLASQLHGLELPIRPFIEPSFDGQITLSIEALNKLDISVATSHHPLAEYCRDSFVIRTRGVWLEPSKIADLCRQSGRLSSRDVVTRVCSNFSIDVVNKLLVLMNVYLPGSSRCLHYYYKDKIFGQSSHACDSSFDDACVILMEAELSPTPNLSFQDFIKWSLTVDGFWTGRPSANVGRAMTFFSHAHHRSRLVYAFADISWIVAALEALFAESSQEIRAKIVRRTISLCPEIEQFTSKKEIGRLYDSRLSP